MKSSHKLHPIYQSISDFLAFVEFPRTIQTIDQARYFAETRQLDIESTIRVCFRQVLSYQENAKLRVARRSGLSGPQGMNTMGVLLDRLSILALRTYILGADTRDISQVEHICDILECIDASQPGSSSKFTKLTNLKVELEVSSFISAFAHLCLSNGALWLSQDVLYLRGPDKLDAAELRKYITFFAHYNILRNTSIEACETLFWNDSISWG